MKILLLDIESAPNTVHVWGLREQDIAINQIIESSYILCWAAKWAGDSAITWRRTNKRNQSSKRMIQEIYSMLEQADVVVTYNGLKFDIPTLHKEFLLHDLPPPPPAKQVDLLTIIRREFRFVSNKLDFISSAIKIGEKTRHEGHTLWVRCMQGDPEAWTKMEEYNRQDVALMEPLYYRLLPWMRGSGLSHAAFGDVGACCPKCGSPNHQRRGYYYTDAGKYIRLRCQKCFAWFRSNLNEHPRAKIRFKSI